MKKKSNAEITYSELMKELDKFRVTDRTRIKLTPEQETFIKKARLHKNPIQYGEMVKLWEKVGWGKINKSAIRNRCIMVLGK